jgi:ribonuclease HII
MKIHAKSFRLCGLDEVGRGAWAGPLVAAAVVAPQSLWRPVARQSTPLRDSKRLTALQRRFWYQFLITRQVEFLTCSISPLQINHRGLAWANREIFRHLIKQLPADEYLVDGRLRLGLIKNISVPVNSQIRADATRLPVILAGIVAKVTRDRLMRQLSSDFPRYHWYTNVGYGTRQHLQAIQAYGITKYHRTRFVTTALKKVELS